MTPETLQVFLAKHNLKEAELARLLGVPHQTVNRWKLGTRTPRLGSIVDEQLRLLGRRLSRRRSTFPEGDQHRIRAYEK